jgi:hypothetical protein
MTWHGVVGVRLMAAFSVLTYDGLVGQLTCI